MHLTSLNLLNYLNSFIRNAKIQLCVTHQHLRYTRMWHSNFPVLNNKEYWIFYSTQGLIVHTYSGCRTSCIRSIFYSSKKQVGHKWNKVKKKKQSKRLTEAQAKRQAGYDQNRYIQAEHNNEKKASEMAVSDSSAVYRVYWTYTEQLLVWQELK